MTATVEELSCGLPPGPDFADLAVYAEQLGYARVWIFDSAALWEDPFVHLGLAAQRTTRIGLASAVLIPAQRSEMAMASAIATIARLSDDRFRPCFGTGATARRTLGQRPWTLKALRDYVLIIRELLSGGTTLIDGAPARMLHADGLTAARPVAAPVWLSVFGPRGAEMAESVADGIIGLPHPRLPTATLISGTVLAPGEAPDCDRVRQAVGPWRVVEWHNAYATGGADAVDRLPGGRQWRETVERLAAPDERHLVTDEGHVTHLMERDRPLLEHIGAKSNINVQSLVGTPAEVSQKVSRIFGSGYSEIIYTPAGPDVRREMRGFMEALTR